MTDLNDATVLITGAAGGFGREMIGQFLAEGSSLVLTDLSCDTVQSIVEKRQDVLGCVAADLSTAEGCDHVYQYCQQQGITVDVLVNNAGIAHYAPFYEYPEDKWELLLQVNLLAPMRLTQHFLPRMIERRRGHVVNISSLAGWVGTPGIVPYSTSKFGLRGFSEALEAEVEPFGIQVTTVFPFYSRTPIVESAEVGSQKRPTLPDELLTDPPEVIREVITGIRQNKKHVFPDKTAKQVHLLKRYAPWLLPVLERRARGD